MEYRRFLLAAKKLDFAITLRGRGAVLRWRPLGERFFYDEASPHFQVHDLYGLPFSAMAVAELVDGFKPLPDFGVIYLRVVPTVGPLLVQALDFFLSKNTLETIIGKLTIVRRNDFEIR